MTGEAQRLARGPDRIREDLAVAGLPGEGDGLFEETLRLIEIVEDRHRRGAPDQKADELCARAERPRGGDRAVELVHGGGVGVEAETHDRGERS